MKNEAWSNIAKKISARGVIRTAQEIKHKWHDLQSRTKGKFVELKKERRRTGGGPAPPNLSERDETILDTIGSTGTEGIDGGVDTAEMEITKLTGTASIASSDTQETEDDDDDYSCQSSVTEDQDEYPFSMAASRRIGISAATDYGHFKTPQRFSVSPTPEAMSKTATKERVSSTK